jgi:DNA-binding beta-propeller fold protein YncE
MIYVSFLLTVASILSPGPRDVLSLEFLFSFGNFSMAKGVAVAPSGLVYIADTGDNKVKVYSPSGDSLREIGGSGWGDLEFDQPYDIAVGAGLNFYVADYGNHRIQRFDKDLNYISTLYTRDSDDPSQRFGYPTSVAVSRLGDLFLLDNENIRVVKVNTFSTIERTFGGIEAGKGRLRNPRKVRVTNQDLVCVLDVQRIVIFDNFGNYIRTIGEGALKDPRGMAIRRDTLFVVDGAEVRLFDSEGRLLEVLTPSSGGQAGLEQSFNDIAVSGQRLFLLTDREVKVYEWREENTLDNH